MVLTRISLPVDDKGSQWEKSLLWSFCGEKDNYLWQEAKQRILLLDGSEIHTFPSSDGMLNLANCKALFIFSGWSHYGGNVAPVRRRHKYMTTCWTRTHLGYNDPYILNGYAGSAANKVYPI